MCLSNPTFLQSQPSDALLYSAVMKIVAKNRKATFDYEVVDTIEAGLMLTGQEVKSCRLGQVSLAGSYVSFLGGRPILKQAKISPYAYAGNMKDYEPGRDRMLLMTKAQLRKLEAAQAEKGISIIPLEVRAGAFIKLLIAVGKGRKRFDKRQKIRDRELGRRIRQTGAN